MSNLVGVWNLVESENWDEYLKVMGVGFMLRKVANTVKPTLTISNDGDKWTFNMTSTFKNQTTSFTEGVSFDETTLDGRESKNVVTREGDKLVQTQTIDKLNNKITREVVNDQLVQVLESGGVVCKRVYKRTA